MREKIKKSSAFIFSVFFHIFIVGGIFYLQFKEDINTSWSGGRGVDRYQVAYVDLGKIDVSPEANVSPDNQKNKKQGEQKQIPVQKNKTTMTLKEKTPQKKSSLQNKKETQDSPKNSGIGDSDTPAGGVGSGLDADGKISADPPNILALIRKKIMRAKTYPQVAKENGWTGSVKVSFKIRPDGKLESVRVIQSSGYRVLDQAAVETVKRSTPLPFYPKVIALKIEYFLE